jgi:hypothetical protein
MCGTMQMQSKCETETESVQGHPQGDTRMGVMVYVLVSLAGVRELHSSWIAAQDRAVHKLRLINQYDNVRV